jgi:Putative quorum-sensing-regulated virulence factor
LLFTPGEKNSLENAMLIPFGKNKGKALDRVPEDYVKWLAGLDNLREPFKTAVAEEVKKCAGKPSSAATHTAPTPTPYSSGCPQPKIALELIDAGARAVYGRLALFGEETKKSQIDACIAWLRKQVQGE